MQTTILTTVHVDSDTTIVCNNMSDAPGHGFVTIRLGGDCHVDLFLGDVCDVERLAEAVAEAHRIMDMVRTRQNMESLALS